MPRPMIALPALLAGVLMATFQLVRPWGDVDGDAAAMAEAFADPRWLVAHLAGAASFVVVAWLAHGLAAPGGRPPSASGTASARIAQVATGVGAALVLPYYGAETFALHELGRAALAGVPVDVSALSDSIRMNPVAVTLFGLGLLLVAAGGIFVSLIAVRRGVAAWAAWPFGVLIALALPQFALPPVGRMAYGVVFLLAAVVFAFGARSVGSAAGAREE